MWDGGADAVLEGATFLHDRIVTINPPFIEEGILSAYAMLSRDDQLLTPDIII
jgi:hypothetical protein